MREEASDFLDLLVLFHQEKSTERNANLLQKVEELTLYLIEQQKRIAELEKQNQRINILEKKLEALDVK